MASQASRRASLLVAPIAATIHQHQRPTTGNGGNGDGADAVAAAPGQLANRRPQLGGCSQQLSCVTSSTLQQQQLQQDQRSAAAEEQATRQQQQQRLVKSQLLWRGSQAALNAGTKVPIKRNDNDHHHHQQSIHGFHREAAHRGPTNAAVTCSQHHHQLDSATSGSELTGSSQRKSTLSSFPSPSPSSSSSSSTTTTTQQQQQIDSTANQLAQLAAASLVPTSTQSPLAVGRLPLTGARSSIINGSHRSHHSHNISHNTSAKKLTATSNSNLPASSATTATPATTNSRVRQGALYARRQYHITPAVSTSQAAALPTSYASVQAARRSAAAAAAGRLALVRSSRSIHQQHHHSSSSSSSSSNSIHHHQSNSKQSPLEKLIIQRREFGRKHHQSLASIVTGKTSASKFSLASSTSSLSLAVVKRAKPSPAAAQSARDSIGCGAPPTHHASSRCVATAFGRPSSLSCASDSHHHRHHLSATNRSLALLTTGTSATGSLTRHQFETTRTSCGSSSRRTTVHHGVGALVAHHRSSNALLLTSHHRKPTAARANSASCRRSAGSSGGTSGTNRNSSISISGTSSSSSSGSSSNTSTSTSCRSIAGADNIAAALNSTQMTTTKNSHLHHQTNNFDTTNATDSIGANKPADQVLSSNIGPSAAAARQSPFGGASRSHYDAKLSRRNSQVANTTTAASDLRPLDLSRREISINHHHDISTDATCAAGDLLLVASSNNNNDTICTKTNTTITSPTAAKGASPAVSDLQRQPLANLINQSVVPGEHNVDDEESIMISDISNHLIHSVASHHLMVAVAAAAMVNNGVGNNTNSNKSSSSISIDSLGSSSGPNLTARTPDIPIRVESICDYYDLETRPFARGKFAQVKRCISKTTKQCFAAKCIKKRRRLLDIRHEILLEIEALKLSYHTDRIIKLYEVFETPTEMILVLEMAKGGELQRVLDDEETIDEAIVRRWVRQILEGLVHLHDNDIAHLDIKPQNLLLTETYPDGNIKLCDFGISRRITRDCEIREICGTPDYVAPEILRYDPISLATDMWSLGVLTYVLLSGYSPFGSENKQETFCNITQATLDFPSEIFDNISKDAIDFMQKLIVREPSERMTSQQARSHPWLDQ